MTKRRSPALAALATLGATGLGQVYNGRPKKAAAMYGLWLAGCVFGALLGPSASFSRMLIFLAAALGVGAVVIVDAIRDARRIGEIELRPYHRWYVYLGIILVQSLVIGPILQSQVAFSSTKAFKIPAGSMIPALEIGDRLIADLDAYEKNAPKRGDIVIFKFPKDESTLFVKRVIGLPGEKIEIKGKSVFVDGAPLDDPWASYGPSERRGAEDYGPTLVPDDSYFLLGDNRDNSFDSRFWGAVEGSKIVGQARFLYWSRKSSRIGEKLD